MYYSFSSRNWKYFPKNPVTPKRKNLTFIIVSINIDANFI